MGGVISFITLRHHEPTEASRQVRTRNGLVEGFRISLSDGKNVDLFLGIPFAKPPIGHLRFKKPEYPCDWEGVRKCVKFGPRAPQADFFWERFTIGVKKSEDCLYLNVFAPDWKPDEEKSGHAVMVYVHGGGFLIDSAVKYGDEGIARYLCRHDVVVVTIQYRLGLLGFFSTGDDICAGNLGLWDMTMALQWVQDNIHQFGGDPRKVTVFGQSAGGASVDLLSISPHSRDLFTQVVPMAGNAECEWSTVNKNRIMETCRDFARRKGWDSEDYDKETSKELLEFLRTRKDAEFEKRLLTRKGVDISKVGLELAPIIGTAPTDFLPRPIADLRKEAPKRNVMVGTCEHEGLLFATLGPNHFDIKGIEKLLSLVITEDIHSNAEELRSHAKKLYISEEDEHDKHAVAEAFTRLYSDLFVNNGTYNYVQKMTNLNNRVFFYSFDYCNPRSFGLLSLRAPFRAATHCTELTYIFGQSIVFPFRFNEEDNKMLDLMTRMWTNFAKYGNPNGPYEDSTVFNFKWEPTSIDEYDRFLSISEKCAMRNNYEDRRAEFWKNVKITSKNT